MGLEIVFIIVFGLGYYTGYQDGNENPKEITCLSYCSDKADNNQDRS